MVNSEKIVINECVHAFSDIIDFSVNEKKSYKSSTSTGSIIGRGIVGGLSLIHILDLFCLYSVCFERLGNYVFVN